MHGLWFGLVLVRYYILSFSSVFKLNVFVMFCTHLPFALQGCFLLIEYKKVGLIGYHSFKVAVNGLFWALLT